jgi:hypothetical protein
MVKSHSGLLDTGEVVHYEAGAIVALPPSLHQWVTAGIAEAVPEAEARDTKVVAPPETKPAHPASYKDSNGDTVSTVSVKRTPLKKKR